MQVHNAGEPIRFKKFEPLLGFAVEAKQKGGETVKICTQMALTSDEPLFHRFTENFSLVVNNMAQQAGEPVSLDKTNTLLLVIKPDNSAELWLDTAAVSIRCMAKRDVVVGSFMFESDITDVTGMSFPCVDIEPKDRVFCIFRVGWSFAFVFDSNPSGVFDKESFIRALGMQYRKLRYRHLYEAFADQALCDRLVASGWFPFAEIITDEFKGILKHCEAGFDMSEIELSIIEKFSGDRLQRILDRWMAKPHFAVKKELLKAAIDAFNQGEPVAVIKILLTEIEGILNDAYRAAHDGKAAKLKELLKFAVASAERKAGRPDTLLFPTDFAHYLTKHTFANFDPVAKTGTAGSRHAVGHGAAAQESYTMTRALQAILTLDQIAFYT